MSVGGEDGGDRLPATGVLPLGSRGAPNEGGDELDRVGGGDPPEIPTSREESGSAPEPAGPG